MVWHPPHSSLRVAVLSGGNSHERSISLASGRCVESALAAAGHESEHVDPADIEAAVTNKTRAILLNSPHNPTGATLTRDELEGIADTCKRHDLWLVCDEVYASQVFDGSHVSACCLPGLAERTITVNSLSKSHAMTGWRLGWLVGPHELARHAGNVALCVLYGSPTFIQEAALVALADEVSPREMNAVYRRRRDLVSERLSGIDTLQCHVPEAGMFMMIDIRRTGLSSQAFAETLCDDCGVSVLAGDAFGASGEGFVRLSFAVADDDLLKASERLAAFGRSLAG